ncbi:MAG TPA: glycosyltransferase family 39 protein [Kofleriaceae bacterium]
MTRKDAGFVVGLATLLHAPSFFRPFMDIDEGSFAGIACRLVEGGRVYHDGVENKLPGMFYVYKAVFAMFGRYNMVAIHVAVTLAAIATAFAIGSIARRFAGDVAERWAALLYVVFSASYYPKMLAGNSEMFAVVPAALAVWCYLRGRDRGFGWFVAAGAFGALTLLCKQVALATFAALLADRFFTGRREPWRALRDLALLVVGFGAVCTAMVLHLRAIGVWDDTVFWTWTYVFRYYIPSGANEHGFAFNLATSFVPFAATVSPLIYLAVRGRDRSQSVLYWWFAGNLAAGFVGGRMYGHYFLLMVPALGTLAGIGAARWLTPVHARERTWLIRLVGAMAIAFAIVAACFEGATGNAFEPSPDYRPASAYVAEHTAPSDRIFVWGWFPALYQAADRCPSTRFMYTHVHAGNAAGGVGHNVPEAWQWLMEDLTAAPPPFILDTSAGDYNFPFPPEGYPELWRFMSARYRLDTTIAGVRIFRRN